MQKPPPVLELLQEMAGFATAVSTVLSPEDIDWYWRPGSDEWSLTEVCCHLRDVEKEVHQARFKALIAQDNAFISGATPDEWVAKRKYQQENGRSAFTAFLQYRQETIALLSGLDETLWQRQGSHSFFGPTSMHELLNLVVGHDRAHWQQVQSLLNH